MTIILLVVACWVTGAVTGAALLFALSKNPVTLPW